MTGTPFTDQQRMPPGERCECNFPGGNISPSLGADLTEWHSRGCRHVEACGLTPSEDHKLTAPFRFWQ